jgi:hypothetical protein
MQFLCTQVFFIDHEHELTTFVDPRLPLPNQQFTYTPIQATVPAARRTSYDNTGLRPHHTTTVRHSQSLDSDLAMGSPTTPTTPQGAPLAPPTLSGPPPQDSSSGNELTVPGASGSGRGGDGAASARASIISESTAPPSEFAYIFIFLNSIQLHV